MISILISIIKIVFLLGFLVFIHEGGHFLVAKACKVKVKEFAIGFGPTILSKKGKETKYALRAIPLGGFVNMLGEEERINEEGSFSNASILKRALIIVAGGLVNIIFGLIVYFILISASGNFITTTVESTLPGYAAEKYGIMPNDKIIKINNKKIKLKTDIDEILDKNHGEEITVTVKRNNETLKIKTMPTKVTNKSIGIFLGKKDENISAKIQSIYKDSPAQKAGIEPGDTVISIDGINVENNAEKLVDLISNSKNKLIMVNIERNNEQLQFEIEPIVTNQYYLGVIFSKAENSFISNIHYGFLETVDFSISIVENLKQLFQGDITKDQLMGPVGISTVVAKTNGIIEYIYLIALVSLSLGVTNLLPFPPLDGGKIIFLIIEAIRKKPIKENIEIGIQTTGFIVIILLSLYITYNDVLRII